MNNAAPDVTVVLPVYNSGATLRRAVISVLGQTLKNFELLIVDDGSTDDSLAVAWEVSKIDPRVEVISMPRNGGKARAMNHATTIARGTWIALLDADDIYLPGRLSALVEAGEANGVDLVADNQHHVDHATSQVVRRAFAAQGPGRIVGLTDFIAHSDPAATFDFGILKPMIRADFLRRTGLAYYPDAKLAEDFYFLLEFFAAGGRAWLVHEPYYEWTLPFSPTARQWTTTGAGKWRYDYRNALQVNRHFQSKYGTAGPDLIAALLRRREHEYGIMVHYIDAQKALAETGSRSRAFAIIATHPQTWPLLVRRIIGRVARNVQRRRVSTIVPGP